ncbi:uncharacterized protein LOC106164567 isoform X2 [Lingula anatina]|uniref:Uncharacterized protein LOC106164567 isoform X2 n=1 Tax=Lingula anatina TaxID=7574 RepID=A0A2R2MPL5_LINAN|nr:uncharacterized protein LOC106164567 isoform X2 [Lingula anatina]|eukprot:XP_023931957.1 uncharacterized protein LOC106164567 isoform X2 [Lingula anatina]
MNFQGLRFRSPSQKVMVGLSVGIIVVLLMFLWIIQGPQLHLTGVTSYNLMDEIISTLRDKNDTDVKQYGDPFFYKEELGGEVASMLQGDVDKFIPELKMTLKEYDRLEKGFYGHLMRQQYDCRNRVRAGISEDGGWEVCMDPQFAIKPGSCLVYSFGLGNEWSFDKYMSKSCTVYGFDPRQQ